MAVDLRNKIVHYEFEVDPAHLKPVFAKLFGFLNDFYRSHFDDPLEDRIAGPLWQEGAKVQEYGEELFRRAKSRMESDDVYEDHVVRCPKCGWEAMAAFGVKQDTCYVCGNVEDLVICSLCDRVVLWGEHEERGDKTYCLECLEY